MFTSSIYVQSSTIRLKPPYSRPLQLQCLRLSSPHPSLPNIDSCWSFPNGEAFQYSTAPKKTGVEVPDDLLSQGHLHTKQLGLCTQHRIKAIQYDIAYTQSRQYQPASTERRPKSSSKLWYWNRKEILTPAIFRHTDIVLFVRRHSTALVNNKSLTLISQDITKKDLNNHLIHNTYRNHLLTPSEK